MSTIFVGACNDSAKNRVRGVDERLDQFHSHEAVLPCHRHRCADGVGIVAEHVPKNFVQHFRLHRLAQSAGAFLQRRQDVLLYPTDETMTMRALVCCRTCAPPPRFPSICGMVMSMSTMSGFDAVEFRDGRQAIPGFAGHFAAEHLDHFDEVFCARRRNRPQRGRRPADYLFEVERQTVSWPSLIPAPAFTCARKKQGSFRLFVLVVLFKTFMTNCAPRRNCSPSKRESVERNNLVGISFNDCRARHPADHEGIFALREVIPPAALIAPSPSAPLVAMPVIKISDSCEAQFLRDGMKQNIRGGTMPIYRRPSERTTMSPRGMRRTMMWRFPGQIKTRPASKRSPERAS